MIFIIMLLTSLSIGIAAFIVAIEIRRKGKTAREYYLNYRVLSYKKTSKTQRILDFIEVVIVKIFCFFTIIILSSVISLLLSLLRNNYNDYIIAIYQSVNVDLVNWVGLMITVAAILVAFKKEYYLTFSIEDVLERFYFRERVFNIVLAMLGGGFVVGLRNIFLSMQQRIVGEVRGDEYHILTAISGGLMLAYLFLFIFSILTGVYLIYRVIYILYSKDYSELEILNILYSKLNSRQFLVSGDLFNGRKGIAINEEYLLEQFKETYYKIKDEEIYDVKFKTVFDGDKFINRKIENKIVRRFIILQFIAYSMGGIITISDGFEKGVDFSYLLKHLVIYIVVWIVAIIIMKWEYLNKYDLISDFKQILYRMVYASKVFTYRMKRKSKEKIAVLGGRGGFDNFITSTINLMVYLKILICNMKTEEDEKIINKYIEDVQKYIEELKNEVEEESRKKEKNLEEEEKEGDKVDCIFYVVNICYEFFRYVNTEGEKQKNILEENKDKDWIKIIKSRDKEWKRIENVIVELITLSQNLYEGNPMQKWHAFKKKV